MGCNLYSNKLRILFLKSSSFTELLKLNQIWVLPQIAYKISITLFTLVNWRDTGHVPRLAYPGLPSDGSDPLLWHEMHMTVDMSIKWGYQKINAIQSEQNFRWGFCHSSCGIALTVKGGSTLCLGWSHHYLIWKKKI